MAENDEAPRREGPVVIGTDGSPAAEHAIREAGALLAGRPAVVVVVFQEGLAFEAAEMPTVTGLPPVLLDVRSVAETEKALYERAQRLAQRGAQLAREAGFDAEGLVVDDELGVSVASTLTDLARERDAQCIVVGAHSKGRLEDVILGSVPRDVIRHAETPVVVVRE
jgi:nucleotide-binding universal stress UspA family protein